MKTTKRHFDIFKKECKKWIKEFGLFGWRFYYRHGDEGDAQDCIAYCCYPTKVEDRVFTLGLTLTLDDYTETTELDIRRSAFHEVMEAMLYRYYYLATARYATGEDIREEHHNIIRILESVVFK